MTMVKAFKTRLRFPRLSEISEDLEAVTDIDDQQEGRIWFGSRKGTDVTFGLAARFDHGVVPGVGAPNRLIRFAHFETGTAGGRDRVRKLWPWPPGTAWIRGRSS